jgi:hypothetical protein
MENILNSLKRIFSNEVTAAKIYVVWGILVLVIFGFLGLYPVTKILVSNFSLVDNLYKSNLSMEENLKKLKEVKEKLDYIEEDIYLLESFVPTDFRSQNYLVEMSDISGESGYFMDKINFSENKDSSVVLSLNLVGKGDPINMISRLESSAKLNEIELIRYSVGEVTDMLNIQIRSFIMDK